GYLMLEPAYEYSESLRMITTINGKKRQQAFPKRDQIAPEFLYFSNCILKDKRPEPSGREGLADVRIVRALYQSAETGRPITLGPYERGQHPSARQTIKRPPVRMP